MSGSAPITLDYGRSVEKPSTPLWLRGALVVLAVPSLFTPWMSFSWNTSPADVVVPFLRSPSSLAREDVLLFALGLPFFLALVCDAWALRLAVAPRTLLVERLVVYVAAAGCQTCTLFVVVRLGSNMSNAAELAILAVPLLLWSLALVALFCLMRWRMPREWCATFAAHMAYVINAALCVGLFAGNHDDGWTVTLGAGVLLLGACLVIFIRAARWRRLHRVSIA